MIIFLSVLWFLVFFAIFGIIGFVLFDFLCRIFKKETPIKIEWVPLYVFLGLILTEIAFFILSFIYVDKSVSYIYVGAFLIYFLLLWLKKYKTKISEAKSGFFQQDKFRIRGILFVFIFILLIFSINAFFIDAAPYGDAIDHTTVISMIIENKKFPSDYQPVDEMLFSIFRYPPGFRVLSVFTTLVSSCYPIEATAFTSVLSSCLIPLLIWSAIYVRTKSISLSLMGLSCSLILPYWVLVAPLDGYDLVLGNLVNGTYPNQLAFLELVGLAAFLTHYRALNGNPPKHSEGGTPEKGSIREDLFLFIGIAFIGFSLILTHYLFTFFVVALLGIKILVVIIVWVKNILEKKGIKNKSLIKMIIGIGLLVLGIIAAFVLIKIVPILVSVFFFSIALPVDIFYLVTNPFGIIITSSIILFLVKIKSQKQFCDADLFFVITSFTMVAAIIVPILQTYFLIAAYRSIIPIAGVAIIQVFCDCPAIVKRYNLKSKFSLSRNNPGKLKQRFWYGIIIFNVFNSIVYIGNSQNASVKPGTNDYEEMVWITQNIDKNALILNEPSFVGLFLTGFEYRNVVYVRQLTIFHAWDSSYYKERASRCMAIYTDPTNYTNVRDIMLLYEISYVQLTMFPNLFDYSTYTEIKKPISALYQVGNFSANPYLELVWNMEYSAVFKLK